MKIFFITFIFCMLFFYWQDIKIKQQEKIDLNQQNIAMEVMLAINNYDDFKSKVYAQKVEQALVGFINKETIEEVREKTSKDIYRLEELGYKHEGFCKFSFDFGEQEKIICGLKSILNHSEDIVLVKNDKGIWDYDLLTKK